VSRCVSYTSRMSTSTATRRPRKPHPGVRIIHLTSRSGRAFYQARFKCPESGRLICESLDAKGIMTAEARRAWAVGKSQEIQRRTGELKIGAAPQLDEKLEVAAETYLASCKATLRNSTHRAYADALKQFSTWAKRVGLTKTSQINVGVLSRYRDFVIALPNGRATKGGRRGQRTATTHPRAPRTVNRDMEYLRTWLRWMIRGAMSPALTHESIANALRRVPTPRPQPEFLGYEDIRKLVEAALAHDADCFRMTRREKDGKLVPGRMPRHTPIAPVALTLLLSGMRRGELLALEWADINLEAKDDHGHAVGEIRIRPEATKTKIARTIDLAVCPALRSLLEAMRERCDGTSRVFAEHTDDSVVTAQRRLIAIYGAPRYSWQDLRSTCATVLVNAPGVFGAASAFRESRQLGHSVTIAERHYAGLLRGIPATARTVEAAMQVEDLAETVVAQVAARTETEALGRPFERSQ
jgi:integrase